MIITIIKCELHRNTRTYNHRPQTKRTHECPSISAKRYFLKLYFWVWFCFPRTFLYEFFGLIIFIFQTLLYKKKKQKSSNQKLKKIAKDHEKATKKVKARRENKHTQINKQFRSQIGCYLPKSKSHAFSQLSALLLKLSLCVAFLSRTMFILRKSMRKLQNIAEKTSLRTRKIKCGSRIVWQTQKWERNKKQQKKKTQ